MVSVVVVIITSKYMSIIIAVKAMTVNKIPEKINQPFKQLRLRLSSTFFLFEFLQSKIINIIIIEC